MFGQRPSTLLGIEDPVVALEVDVAGAVVVKQTEAEAMEAAGA
jgi:hypothetical protein